MQEIKFTETGKSYWEGTGSYQKEYDEIYNQLIPGSGVAETLQGELLRAAVRLNYEYYNNGNCNACECKWEEVEYPCHSCDDGKIYDYDDESDEETETICMDCAGTGSRYEEECTEINISEYYENFLELISTIIPHSMLVCHQIEECILSDLYSSKNQFIGKYSAPYNHVLDIVLHHIVYVMPQEPVAIPEWYDND